MNEPKPLNRLEVWVAEHSAPIFGCLAVLIVAGAGAVFWTYQRTGDAEQQINVLRPKVAHIVKCNQSSLVDDKRAAECAARIRIGLINCRRSEPCRAALLAAITFPPPADATAPSSGPSSTTAAPATKGGAAQQPSNHGHQQPGPGSPGHHGGPGQGRHEEAPTEAAQEAPPASSPASSSSPPPEPSSPAESPVNSAEGGSTSGVGVEVCALERTCVGIEAGLNPKGLLP